MVVSTEMFWGINLFPMCIPFVTAQTHENFSSFQHALGLQLTDHVENDDGLFRTSLGALDTKMFWGLIHVPWLEHISLSPEVSLQGLS